jgi:hypothetical protein
MKRLLVFAWLAVSAMASAQFFDQEPSADAYGAPSDGYTTNGSQFWSNANADNFSVSGTTTLGSIGFWGGSGDGSGNTNSSTIANVQSFDIAIYNSDFSSIVYSESVAASLVTSLATGRTLTDIFDGYQGGNEYYFTAGATTTLAAGQYWLTIGVVLKDPQGDSFMWTAATADGKYGENFFDGTGWTVYTDTADPDQDLAFRLYAPAAVPEPSSWLVFAPAALLLLKRRR